MRKLKCKNNNYIVMILFYVSCLIFAIPSIFYYFRYKTILKFPFEFKFCLTNNISSVLQGIIYFIVLFLMISFYIEIIKKRKQIFNTNKKLFLFILIISIIFLIVVPVSSSDIFYYLGIGRIDGTYGQNPYYTTIKNFVENENNIELLRQDTVLAQGYINVWSNTTVVYGPIWTLICRIVSLCSFGNINVGLLVFKIFNLIVHLLNCLLIYKLANKKVFTLMYGLNPLILIEGIACVHNDIYMVFFVLLSLYFLLKRKNLLFSVTTLAIATALKYFTIILLPFIIIYYFRKEKSTKRFLRCIEYGLYFVFVLALCYLLYLRDFQVLQGIFTMQTRIAKNFYTILCMYFSHFPNIISYVKNIFLILFTIFYASSCIKLLSSDEIKFRAIMKIINRFLLAFLFLLITNFQPWYIMWLFPCLMWQKTRNIKFIIVASIFSQLANTIFFMFTERWQNGIPFTLVFIGGLVLFVIIDSQLEKTRKKKLEEVSLLSQK